jgi:aspartate beta-hydroxylase
LTAGHQCGHISFVANTTAPTNDDLAPARAARDLFLAALASGRSDAGVLLGLARACGKLGEYAEMLAPIDKVLAMEPRHSGALILKGDYFAATGNDRAASSFYLAAVRSAPPTDQIPVELLAELRRAQTMCEHYAAQYQAYLVEQLTAKGFDPATSSPRFAQSLDIVLGKKKIYLQEPRFYFFPGLPQIQFYERAKFPWLDEVEQAAPAIRAELLNVLSDPDAFAPYVQGAPNRPRKEQAGMLNNPDWSAFYLWQNGQVVEANAARCPNTMRALQNVPLSCVPGRSPSVLFSLLKPGTRIPPHNG